MYSQRWQQPQEKFNCSESQKWLPKSLHRRYNWQALVIKKAFMVNIAQIRKMISGGLLT